MIKELTAEKNISSLIEKLEKQHALDKEDLVMLLSTRTDFRNVSKIC
ncbi:MAG: hypothetical protein PWQ34_1192 [Caldanaerobacter sp.]|jgi:biotin synthase|uniref:Uncharacterized protein n=1 Tax=Caldanaerobacter subterraneus TaxID=911092 RepID=A0A4R2JWP4_9THEO|nr:MULTISPECIES: hypothetical protein [Caldanaerobacter]MDI3519045.1 hypothetical protein [Caldanaerobacter sp.]MDK2794554.1 hypothetical protein [Caldanaerobacter sp.]TCO63562.1 hypothetical protein EV203_11417 [Caldanaerobacter subterraneus]